MLISFFFSSITGQMHKCLINFLQAGGVNDGITLSVKFLGSETNMCSQQPINVQENKH